jgi:hypothetical protein
MSKITLSEERWKLIHIAAVVIDDPDALAPFTDAELESFYEEQKTLYRGQPDNETDLAVDTVVKELERRRAGN